MPTYLDPINGLSDSEAYAEAAVAAGVDDVRLATYEVWHPAMSTPVRVVANDEDFAATLEDTAPRNALEEVVFKRSRVSQERAEEGAGASGDVQLRVDNVSLIIASALRTIKASNDPAIRDAKWQVIERVYMYSEPGAPARIPVLKLTLTRCVMNGATAVFTASHRDSVNTAIPAISFTPESYPGLLP